MMNIITIDLEEWFIYNEFRKGSPDFYLPILNRYLDKILFLLESEKIKATFFCLGFIAREFPDVIRLIASKGHDIGCHSNIHTNIHKQNPQQFASETRIAIDMLEQICGEKVTMYRAPAFSISTKTKWALEILIELGIEIDSSIFPTNRSFGGYPRYSEANPHLIETSSGNLKEFPISYSNLLGMRFMYSGGGYFRLIPYFGIKKIMSKSQYNMAYFHLRDLDGKQKRICSVRYFQSYIGIKHSYSKFEKFIKDYDFMAVSEANEIIDWNSVNTLHLKS